MSAPSVARARLHVVGSSCRFAGVLSAPESQSERPGVDRRHRSCHEYRLTRNVACLHIGTEEMSASFRYVRAISLPPHSSRPDPVSKRSEALWHVSDDAQPSCVLPATVWLLVRAHLDECRVPSPAASIGPCSLHRGGYLGSDGWLGGEEARVFQVGDELCVPRLALRRQFDACLENAQRVVQRRRAAFPGQLESLLHVFHTPSRFHLER